MLERGLDEAAQPDWIVISMKMTGIKFSPIKIDNGYEPSGFLNYFPKDFGVAEFKIPLNPGSAHLPRS